MRSDIETFLDIAKESTAKTISNRIGLPQKEVAKELHRMHGQGIVEREKRKGGGNEYTYWLARGKVPSEASTGEASPPGVTDSSAQASANVPQFDDLDRAVAELDAVIAKASSAPEKPEAEQGASTVGEAFEKLCGQMCELLDVLGLPPTMKEAIAAARKMKEIAVATSIERDELRAELECQHTSNARLKKNNAELELRIDELELVDAEFKPNRLFVTVGRYAKPMRHDSLEKAQKRGKALVRCEKETEVLVCEPVGRIVRGTEWVAK